MLSAAEGLQLAAPALHDFVIPITVVILILLVAVQRHGTAAIGAIFGPLTLVWFAVLAALGIGGILQAPEVLLTVNPWYAVRFFADNGMTGYFVLYAVFLVTTGVLYERVIVVTMVFEPVPTTSGEERIEFTQLDAGFYRITLRYGFMQTPNIPSELHSCAELGLDLELDQVHYIVGHVDLLAGRKRPRIRPLVLANARAVAPKASACLGGRRRSGKCKPASRQDDRSVDTV